MPMMIATSIVATRTNATGNGPYFAPSHKESPTPTTNWTKTATSGDFHRGWTWAKIAGNRRIRPMAYQVRVVALAAEFEFAMPEYTTASLMLRRGSLVSSARGAAASNPMNARIV